MSGRQQLSDEQQKQQKINNERAEQYAQQFKGPVLSHQATGNQVIPNTIDSLIQQCLMLHQQVDSLTSKLKDSNGELSTLKAVNSDKKSKK